MSFHSFGRAANNHTGRGSLAGPLVFLPSSFFGVAFQFRHFGQTATMTFGPAESRGEKCPDEFPGERMADHAAAQANHVQIVVNSDINRPS